jgi:hypothetical protein
VPFGAADSGRDGGADQQNKNRHRNAALAAPSTNGSCSEERHRGGVCFAIARLNIRQMTEPSRFATATPKPIMRRVKTSITTMTQ